MAMDFYLILTLLISIAAVFAYINHRYLKMPFIIGLFFLSTIASLIIISCKSFAVEPFIEIKKIVKQTNISRMVLEVMLGPLLFAGSLHTDWAHIKEQLKPITLFAVGGVVVSTFLVAVALYFVCNAMHFHLDLIYCLLFGALISPTDPIAVIGILTKAGVPKKIETIIVGESLFNDGVGVVMFITLLEAATSSSGAIDYPHAGLLFLQQAVGGIAFGLVLGFVLHKLVRSITHNDTKVLLTIAFVTAGYAICTRFHLSGALAMVVMGLLVGNYRHETSNAKAHRYVLKFWELADVVFNAVLFILIALVLILIDFKIQYIVTGLLGIIIVLISRIAVVYLPMLIFPKTVNLNKKEARLIVWGGLRGGLSIALILSLPDNETKNILLVLTYCCVFFSILVQGLTIKKMASFSQ